MTRIELTRPAGTRPPSVLATAEVLTRRLHAQVKPYGVRYGDESMTVVYTTVAHDDDARRACAKEVKAPVQATVLTDEEAARRDRELGATA